MSNRTTRSRQPQISTRLMALYPCSTKHHAYWIPPKQETKNEHGKVAAPYVTVERAVTEKDWQDHIDGKRALVPYLTCDDGTAKVALLDVDIYGIELSILTVRASGKAADFPLYVRPTKSAAAHIVAFLEKPIPAEEAQLIAKGIAKKLDLFKFAEEYHPAIAEPFEFYPKNADLNMPYLGGKGGFVRPNNSAEQIPIEEFLRDVRFLDQKQIDALIKLGKTVKDKKRRETTGDDGSAFAQRTLDRFVAEILAMPEGTRNKRLYVIGCRMGNMTHPDSNWIDRETARTALTAAYQQAGWKDEDKTQATLIRGLDKGRETAHAELSGGPVIVGIRKIDYVHPQKPIWYVTIEKNNGTVVVTIRTIEDLMRYQQFVEQCASQHQIAFPPMSIVAWLARLRDPLDTAEIEPPPPQTTTKDEFKEKLTQWLTNRNAGRKLDDILVGRPFEDEDEQLFKFRLEHLHDFVKREGMKEVTRAQVKGWVEELGAVGFNTSINGYSVRLTLLPSAQFQKMPTVGTPRFKNENGI